VIHTPFENLPPANPWRQQRLYQAFYLLRDYQFEFEELLFNPGGNLSLEKDPKRLWAETHLQHTPLEINTADYTQLIRIPGVGNVSARKILNARSSGKIRDLQILAKMGVSPSRAAHFILLDGQRPAYQLELFP
jgi:predicted DNA-binding helix-hairpin-helix protein